MTKYNKLFFVITEVVQAALVLSIGVDAHAAHLTHGWLFLTRKE